MVKSLSPFALFPVREETSRCAHILTLKWSLVLNYLDTVCSDLLSLELLKYSMF